MTYRRSETTNESARGYCIHPPPKNCDCRNNERTRPTDDALSSMTFPGPLVVKGFACSSAVSSPFVHTTTNLSWLPLARCNLNTLTENALFVELFACDIPWPSKNIIKNCLSRTPLHLNTESMTIEIKKTCFCFSFSILEGFPTVCGFIQHTTFNRQSTTASLFFICKTKCITKSIHNFVL